jgi:hypothetical protein
VHASGPMHSNRIMLGESDEEPLNTFIEKSTPRTIETAFPFVRQWPEMKEIIVRTLTVA